MSLYNNTSNSKTKTDSGVNELIDKLDNFEKQADIKAKITKWNEKRRKWIKNIKKINSKCKSKIIKKKFDEDPDEGKFYIGDIFNMINNKIRIIFK